MLRETLGIMKDRGYRIYDLPYRLNIVATRSRSLRSNSFDDTLEVFFRDGKLEWVHFSFPCTTDPGQYWLDHPMHPEGTAFLKRGQYRDCYSLGYHRGIYWALVQVRPVTVIRDYDRSGLFNWTESGFEDTGNFGINVHRAFKVGTARTVDQASAGCIVLADAGDYETFMRLCDTHARIHGKSFTLTMLDFRDRRRRWASTLAWAGAITFIAGGTTYYINENIKELKKSTPRIGRVAGRTDGRKVPTA